MDEIKEQDEFDQFLTRKELSFETKKLYNLYHRKLLMLLRRTEKEMDQEILNAFLEIYPHAISKAFLRNYLEFKDILLKIQKKTGTKPTKEVESISDNDLIKIRERLYAHDERFGLMFDLSESCALRRQEVLNIKCSDISLKEIDGKESMFIKLTKTKGDKERSVFVLEKVAVKVIEFIAINNLSTNSYLFRSNAFPEKPMDKTMWNKAFLKASLEATGKRYHPHQLRHTRSLKWHENGVDIVRIKQRLGHSNISTTMLYINPDKRKEMEKWSKESE